MMKFIKYILNYFNKSDLKVTIDKEVLKSYNELKLIGYNELEETLLFWKRRK